MTKVIQVYSLGYLLKKLQTKCCTRIKNKNILGVFFLNIPRFSSKN